MVQDEVYFPVFFLFFRHCEASISTDISTLMLVLLPEHHSLWNWLQISPSLMI